MSTSAPSITQEIALLDLQIERLKPGLATHPFIDAKNQRPTVKENRPIKNSARYSTRASKDRRSGEDQRAVGDLNYFKKGGIERRSYLGRRRDPERRSSRTKTKHKGLARLLSW